MSDVTSIKKLWYRKHYWKIRNQGFRKLWIKRGWNGKGAWCEKSVEGKTIIMQIVEKHPDYFVCSFVFKEDVLASY